MIKTKVKTIVYSPEHFARLEILLFRNRMTWKHNSNDAMIFRISRYPMGIIINNLDISLWYLDSRYDLVSFDKHEYEEIDIDLYLATKGTCQQTKGTLQ